jgi:photosystem II stability/assembly factor-like uncharacterized protein
MRSLALTVLCMGFCAGTTIGQQVKKGSTDNIYTIKKQYLYQVLHNPTEAEESENDNELERFDRWFHMAEPRTYPTGNLPRTDMLLRATQQQRAIAKAAKATNTVGPWQPLGPLKVPVNHNGIGRVNCIVIDPIDTSKLYVGSACGGVFISQDGGNTWSSHTDNFPSLSIADIAVNPHNTDTIYAATGDGYGYENGSFNMFWGGLYSAGVMISTNGGASWDTTGLSYQQSNRDMVQRLLIHPNKTNILLAATRNGLKRTTDAGATWTTVDAGHIYSLAFRPDGPDTVYSISNQNLRVSYDAGATWSTLRTNISLTNDRSSIGVTPVAPNAIYVLTANDSLKISHDAGQTFTTTASPESVANFYGYYDRVLAVSPSDSTYVEVSGMNMTKSTNSGATWAALNPGTSVHVDNHAFTFNPQRQATMYTGNDGGISVSYDGGTSWKNISNGLMISQIYSMGCSKQNPNLLICGLQDNGTFTYNGAAWLHRTGGDGMDCAIHPLDDNIQVSSYQNGNFFMSYDKGINFSSLTISSTETGAWLSPVVFDPNNEFVAYFGLKHIFATYDQGGSFVQFPSSPLFTGGAVSMAMSGSSSQTIYAADYGRIYRTTNGGATWTHVTGSSSSLGGAITSIAVDPRDSMLVYITVSGYTAGKKVYKSTVGGVTWTNISGNLPNLPANCIAVDSTTPGALFVGTDMGVFYTDASQTGWTPYSTELPNVIVDKLDVNYTDYKIRAATYGRGVWVTNLKKALPVPNSVASVNNKTAEVTAYPNPTTNSWKLVFANQKPVSYDVTVRDIAGRTVSTTHNADAIDASMLANGVYTIDVVVGENHYTLKAVKK